MNDATNDATEFESSLDGAIGFFQNLRRKLGALEQDAGAQHERLRAIAAAVATLEQDRQIDRRTLDALVGNLDAQAAQLTELQAGSRLLDEQFGSIETLATRFQETQEQLRQQFATLTSDWQAQSADLRQELAAAREREIPADQIAALEAQLAEQAQELRNLLASFQHLGQDARTLRDQASRHESHLERHQGQIGRLETAVQASQEQLGQFSGIAETQYQHLHRLESALGAIDQNARNLGQVVEDLKTALDRHDHRLDNLHQTVESHETARRQQQEQQARLDEFAESLDARQQESQTLNQSLARLWEELETQRQASNEASQTRQDVQKQQDRLKHLETLIGKISSDTHSTRQMLNILQSDLITQSDTLRELDQHWQAILAAYQTPAPSPATPDAQTAIPAVAPDESSASSASASVPPPNPAADRSRAALAVETERLEQEIHQALNELQDGLLGQDARFAELRGALQDQLDLHRERLDRFEATLDQLQESPAAAPDLDLLRDDLAAQAQALREFRETAREQAVALAQKLELQHGDVRETTAKVEEFQQQFDELRQTLARLDSTVEEQGQRDETDRQQELNLQRELATLQDALTALEERLSGQAQAFSGNFEQFRALASDIRHLQQQISALESTPQRLNALEAELLGRESGIARLQDAVRQLQEDSRQMGEALQQTDSGPLVEELEARLNEQRQQFTQINEALDAIRADAKTTQEKVITMATNVAKRIFEFQNQLTATETAHAERLQEVEQKLIQLQAALETMDTQQRKGRRWLSMPATFTHVLLTAGAGFLGVLATVIWTAT